MSAIMLIPAMSNQNAFATIVGFPGCSLFINGCEITTEPPNPVAKDPNNGILLVWNEVQNKVLSQDLRVDRVADESALFIGEDAGGFFIKAGTIVSSHYVEWDNGSGSSNTVAATMEFDSEIFAFITADQKLFDSDAELGLPGLDYNDFGSRGLEGGDATVFNGKEVDIDWFATSPGDWTRLITAFSPAAEPDPEPISEINCDYTNAETSVVLNGVLNYTVNGSCDITRGDTVEMKNVIVDVSKEILSPLVQGGEKSLFGLAHPERKGPSTLFSIDKDTGNAVAVGPVGFNGCSGMEADTDGTLYATCDRVIDGTKIGRAHV